MEKLAVIFYGFFYKGLLFSLSLLDGMVNDPESLTPKDLCFPRFGYACIIKERCPRQPEAG